MEEWNSNLQEVRLELDIKENFSERVLRSAMEETRLGRVLGREVLGPWDHVYQNRGGPDSLKQGSV